MSLSNAPSGSEAIGDRQLGLRYRLQVHFPETGAAEEWETIRSFDSAMDALRGCSECYDSVRDLLDLDWGSDIERGFISLRILDADEGRIVLWEEENGALCSDGGLFGDPA